MFAEALGTLELERALPALGDALVIRASYLLFSHRQEEGTALLRHALALAEEHDLPNVALRARFNLASASLENDRLAETVAIVNEALVLARQRGDRTEERMLQAQLIAPLVMLGRWDEAEPIAAVIAGSPGVSTMVAAVFLAQIAAGRGDDATLERCRAAAVENRASTDGDVRASAELVLARDAFEHAAVAEAQHLARAVLDQADGTASELVVEAYALSIDAAFTLADDVAIGELEAFVGTLPPGRATPLLRAGRASLAAEQAQRHGDIQGADSFWQEAIALLRGVGARPLLARVLLEQGRRCKDPDALAEGRAIFAELGASHWLARIDETSGVAA